MSECKSQPPHLCLLANVLSKSLILKEWCSSWHFSRAEARVALPAEGQKRSGLQAGGETCCKDPQMSPGPA